jgi:transposase
MAEIRREHDLSETLLRRWRDEIIEVVRGAPSGGRDRSRDAEQRRRTAQLERALGRKTIEVEIAGQLLRGAGGAPRGAVCSGGVRDPVVGRCSGP